MYLYFIIFSVPHDGLVFKIGWMIRKHRVNHDSVGCVSAVMNCIPVEVEGYVERLRFIESNWLEYESCNILFPLPTLTKQLPFIFTR